MKAPRGSSQRWTRRRSIRIGSAAAGGGILVACQTGANATPAPAPPANGPVKLTYITDWSIPARLGYLQAVTPLYQQEHPNVSFDFSLVNAAAGESLDDKILVNAASGVLEDIVKRGGDVPLRLYAQGFLKDIGPNLKTLKVNMNTVVNIPSQIQYRGKQFGMPFHLSLAMLTINKTLFKQSGATLPDAKTTWSDLVPQLTKIARPADNVWAFNADFNQSDWLPLVWGFGGDTWTKDHKKSLIDRPESVDGLQYWNDLLNKYKVAPPLDEKGGWSSTVSRGAGNLAVAWTSGPSRNLARTSNFELDMMYHPLGPKTNKRDIFYADQPNSVTTNAAKRGVFDQAVQFVAWLSTSDAAQNLFADMLPEVPVSKKVLNSDHYLKPQPGETYTVAPPASMNIVFEQIPSFHEPEIFIGVNDWYTAVKSALLPAFRGLQSVASAATEAARLGDQALASAAAKFGP